MVRTMEKKSKEKEGEAEKTRQEEEEEEERRWGESNSEGSSTRASAPARERFLQRSSREYPKIPSEVKCV